MPARDQLGGVFRSGPRAAEFRRAGWPDSIPTSFRQAAISGTDRMLEIIAREQPIRPAAVLIPVVDHPQPTVLLTQRSAHLNDHAGQISFPGGKIDAADASPLDAALREAWEEVGLIGNSSIRSAISISTGPAFGFRILPTVARVRPGFTAAHQRSRSGRCLRGSAGVPDESGEPPDAQQGIPRHGALLLRHAVCGALYLGRHGRAFCACCMSGFICHDSSGFHRSRHFPDPVCGLCAVFDRDTFRTAGAVVLAGALIAKLLLGALLLVVVSFVLLAHFSGASPNSTYIPAHIENGKLVPGVEK